MKAGDFMEPQVMAVMRNEGSSINTQIPSADRFDFMLLVSTVLELSPLTVMSVKLLEMDCKVLAPAFVKFG